MSIRMKTAKKYLITGLLVWVPVIVTLFVLNWGYGIIQQIFVSLIHVLQQILPQSMHQFLQKSKEIPGVSALFMLLMLGFTGVFASNIIGQWWLKLSDRFFTKIPIVKTIYSTVKQLSDALFSSNGQVFKEAVWVPYPETGIYSVGFVTAYAKYYPEFDREMLTIFLPTIPTPTAGFLLMVPAENVKKMNMSVDEALRYVVSLGVGKQGVLEKS